MHDTLPALIERALMDNTRPLEFYLRDQSHLPGARANLGLVGEVSDELASIAARRPEQVWDVLRTLTQDALAVETNTPAEFVALCGTVAFGACAASYEEWQTDVSVMLSRLASSRGHRSASSGRKVSSARSPVSVKRSQSRIWVNQSSSSIPLRTGCPSI